MASTLIIFNLDLEKMNRLQGQANNFEVLVDFSAQLPFLQLYGTTGFSTSLYLQKSQLHQGPIATPTVLEENEELKRVIKNHRGNRLHLKKQIHQAAEELTPRTPEFEEEFKEAKDYYENCEVYKDERMKILQNYLFDPSRNNEMPQKFDIVNISTRTIYNHWAKQNGLGRRSNPSWSSIQRSNHILCQEWKEIAAKVDEEQEKHLGDSLGDIYADKEQGHGTDDSCDNNLFS